jgi:glutamate-1-semialdehyde 2,1-aminomutase
VKFEGQYHGVHDYALISVTPDVISDLGDSEEPVGLAYGRGIPQSVADTIIPARYNSIERLRRLFERRGEEIAAIIVEPVLGNAQGILPKPGFHQAMRALTQEFGILLIFDESRRASASPAAVPPSTSASSRTSRPMPRRWATATPRRRSAEPTR